MSSLKRSGRNYVPFSVQEEKLIFARVEGGKVDFFLFYYGQACLEREFGQRGKNWEGKWTSTRLNPRERRRFHDSVMSSLQMMFPPLPSRPSSLTQQGLKARYRQAEAQAQYSLLTWYNERSSSSSSTHASQIQAYHHTTAEC